MHFRKLVAYVFKEFTAEKLGKSVQSVEPEDILLYINSLRACHNGNGVADTVRMIFQILFNSNPKYQEVADFVSAWLRKADPILSVNYELLIFNTYILLINTIFFVGFILLY